MEIIPGALELIVHSMTWEADDVLSVTLARPDGGDLPEWTLGSHVDLILQPDLIRQYSLCSNPQDRDKWTIAILREQESSGGSKYIHDVLRPGMTIAVAGPRSNFPLVDAEHYLFIAGGIGVTPLLPMVRALDASHADWQMLYGGRRRASMAFLKEQEAFGPRMRIAPEEEFGLLDLRTAIESTPPDTVVYCCGPEPLIAAVEAQCAASGRPEPHVERFKARPGFVVDSSQDGPFELVLANSGTHVIVPADKTIIEVLNAAHIFVPTSCTEGYCGVCETEVISGIPDHRDEYLTDEIRATNKRMMLCVGRSKTPELVVKL